MNSKEKEMIGDVVKSLEDLKVYIDKIGKPTKENEFVSVAMPFLSIAFDNLSKTLDEYIRQYNKIK